MEYKSQNMVCQNCKTQFIIEPEDFKFYEKIKVPTPSWCPECRMIRRMSWRNSRTLYKTNCMMNGHNESIISIFSKDKKNKVFSQKCWWGNEWDPIVYGKDYDFSRPFFSQFIELLKEVPLLNLSNLNPIDTDYANMTIDSKNCYLVFSGQKNENCFYFEGLSNCQDCLDVLNSIENRLSYELIDSRNCFNSSFCIKSKDCIDSLFLYDCRNCQNCFGCWNLRNKKYCIFNEQFLEEEYLKKINEFNLGSYIFLEKIKKEFKERSLNKINKFINAINSQNISGDNIDFSKNCHNSFDVFKIIDCKHVWRLLKGNCSNNHDITVGTAPELCYEGNGIGESYNSKFCIASGGIKDSFYTFCCVSNSSNLFACVSLNNKQYCILNKQYTKEEYEELVPKIIQHMNDMPYIDSKGRIYKYGEFFPPELSPFCYNETIAQEYFPLTKEEALKQGYKWKDKEERNYKIDIYNKDIPDDIKEVDDSIINKVIECEHQGKCNEQCTEAFKIIPDELSFYKRMNLPLPRLCPNCRHYQRLKQRNPLKLWHRKCMKEGCTNEFETSYAPDRLEIVYCEGCYNKEVY